MSHPAVLSQTIAAHGFTGRIICLHSSMKSFGPLEGGADAVIDGFLENRVTLVVPTFTYMCEIPIPESVSIPRNAYPPPHPYDPAIPFRPVGGMISPEMGVLPARVLARAGCVRGNHPLNSLTGIGPEADRLIAGQSPLDVYAPYRTVCEEAGSLLVLAGVGLTSATPIHFAEQCAGRQLFRRWALLEDGSRIGTAVGSCSEGFERLEAIVQPVERQIRVAESFWRIFPLRDLVERVAAAIRLDPSITSCGSPDCGRCRDAALGGPLV